MAPPPSSTPVFTVIVLYWNNLAYLPKCLDHLTAQIFKEFEIILVNNGSSQPLPDHFLDSYSSLNIRVLDLPQNVGFAAGNNLAAQQADGEYLALLNADAFPQPDWLAEMHAAIRCRPGCFFASMLIMADRPSVLDGEGDTYHFSGLAWRKSYLRPVEYGKPAVPRPVFSACGAAAIYPKSSYLRVGGFDEDFFSYLEDVDLGFRLRLMGLDCFLIPTACVHHVGSASTGIRSNFAIYHGQRNIIWTFTKNMPGILFWLLLPAHIGVNLAGLITASFRKEFRVVFKAKIDAIRGIPKILAKRREIQANRAISVVRLAKHFDWDPVSPLTKRFPSMRRRLA